MGDYFYSVYGLTVRSEVELSELIEINKDDISEIHNKIDVNIKYDEIPEYVMEDINNKNGCSYSFNESWFYIPHVAIYRICNGKDIYIKHIGGRTQEIKTFLLGGAFICLLFQRKTIAIHGGSILVNGGGIIVTGICGAGKSTLTSAFRKSGYKYLADDLSVIGINSYGKLEVKTAYPQQKLCRDAAVKLGYNINKLVIIDEGRDKFAVPARNDFINLPTELKAIFEIIADNSVKDIKIEEIKGIKKLNYIIDNIYESDIAKYYGLDSFMNMLLEIAKKIPYYIVTRPQNLFTVDEQIHLIKSVL